MKNRCISSLTGVEQFAINHPSCTVTHHLPTCRRELKTFLHQWSFATTELTQFIQPSPAVPLRLCNMPLQCIFDTVTSNQCILITVISGQSNLAESTHRCSTWTVLLYSRGGANVHPCLMHVCFLGPTRVHNPNGISIGSAVFAGLTIVTDRQTTRLRFRPSVEIGRIYVRTAMRPNNVKN